MFDASTAVYYDINKLFRNRPREIPTLKQLIRDDLMIQVMYSLRNVFFFFSFTIYDLQIHPSRSGEKIRTLLMIKQRKSVKMKQKALFR